MCFIAAPALPLHNHRIRGLRAQSAPRAAGSDNGKMNASLPWEALSWDGNADGHFTVTDVGLLLETLFFLPGDTLIWFSLRYVPTISRFLEVDSSEYGSTFSALLSVLVWLAITVFLLTASHWIALLDRAVTTGMRSTLTGVLTRAHIVWETLAGTCARAVRAVTRWWQRGEDRPKLSSEELRVLRAHAYIDPAAALALSDLVRATGVPRMQIVDILDRLRELRLLDRRVDPNSNEFGYALTSPGRQFLSSTH